jgi:uroporphyrinogen-III decarboxylase
VWFNLLGFFWWPRTLLGIERHLLAFYDQPALIHRINQDQVRYQRRCIEALGAVARPVMMNFWEDLSYNHGPMLSRPMFDEFLAPYYREIVPELEARDIVPLLDSDGQIEPIIPWFEGVGIRGCGPLERMAGVDVNRIRRSHPAWIMMGGFDKTVMPRGEEAMRAEFERLLPALRAGRFIPAVDHQTPPGVSLAQYRAYRRLQDEYAIRAVSG